MFLKRTILVSFLIMSYPFYSSDFNDKFESWKKNSNKSCCSRPEEQKCCVGLLLVSSYFFLTHNSSFEKDPLKEIVYSPCFVFGGTFCCEATSEIIQRHYYLKSLDLKKIK